jgi:hypothetical protein
MILPNKYVSSDLGFMKNEIAGKAKNNLIDRGIFLGNKNIFTNTQILKIKKLLLVCLQV